MPQVQGYYWIMSEGRKVLRRSKFRPSINHLAIDGLNLLHLVVTVHYTGSEVVYLDCTIAGSKVVLDDC